MSSESHNTIARRIIAEYQQDSEAFEKKYVDRPDLIKLMSDPSKHAEFLALASAMDMAIDNPIQAFENYPEIFSFMKGGINRMDAFEFSNIIQKIPEKFHEWQAEIDALFGKTKIRKIKELLVYYDVVSSDDFYKTLSPIVQKTLDGIREELIEQQQYWLDKLNELEILDNTDVSQDNPLKVRIERHFSFMKERDLRQNNKILSDNEFKLLVNWLTYYFTNDLLLPEIKTPIHKAYTSKGFIAWAFMSFYKDMYPKGYYPDSLFELIKLCFRDFKDDSIKNIRKTTRPDNFWDVVKKER